MEETSPAAKAQATVQKEISGAVERRGDRRDIFDETPGPTSSSKPLEAPLGSTTSVARLSLNEAGHLATRANEGSISQQKMNEGNNAGVVSKNLSEASPEDITSGQY